MDDNDRNLLLTTARVLRAHLNDEIVAQRFDRNRFVLAQMKRDRDDLDEVLEPYSPRKPQPLAHDDVHVSETGTIGLDALKKLVNDRRKSEPLNPGCDRGQMFVGTKEQLDAWGQGPHFLVVYPDGVRCECGGVVEHCGESGGSELFRCRACGTRGSRLADRHVLPEHAAIIGDRGGRLDRDANYTPPAAAEVPADVAAAIRDGQLHQRDRFSKHGDPIPPPPPRTGVLKSGVPSLGRLFDWAFRYRA